MECDWILANFEADRDTKTLPSGFVFDEIEITVGALVNQQPGQVNVIIRRTHCLLLLHVDKLKENSNKIHIHTPSTNLGTNKPASLLSDFHFVHDPHFQIQWSSMNQTRAKLINEQYFQLK